MTTLLPNSIHTLLLRLVHDHQAKQTHHQLTLFQIEQGFLEDKGQAHQIHHHQQQFRSALDKLAILYEQNLQQVEQLLMERQENKQKQAQWRSQVAFYLQVLRLKEDYVQGLIGLEQLKAGCIQEEQLYQVALAGQEETNKQDQQLGRDRVLLDEPMESVATLRQNDHIYQFILHRLLAHPLHYVPAFHQIKSYLKIRDQFYQEEVLHTIDKIIKEQKLQGQSLELCLRFLNDILEINEITHEFRAQVQQLQDQVKRIKVPPTKWSLIQKIENGLGHQFTRSEQEVSNNKRDKKQVRSLIGIQ